jgi:ElaB/YqjD/DUF883 family membrane-anchored ribosome-binding protein
MPGCQIGRQLTGEDAMDRAEFRRNQGNDGDLLSEQDYAEGSGSTFDRVKFVVANLLSEAAEAIHIKSAGAGGSDISNLGDRAANWLEHSAGYVRDMEPQQLRSDIEDTIRRNPGRSLIIAGVIGLVLGSMLRRR